MAIEWPEPKHLPKMGGTMLNPDRIDFIYGEIKQELVAGEILELIERLVDVFADEGFYLGRNDVY